MGDVSERASVEFASTEPVVVESGATQAGSTETESTDIRSAESVSTESASSAAVSPATTYVVAFPANTPDASEPPTLRLLITPDGAAADGTISYGAVTRAFSASPGQTTEVDLPATLAVTSDEIAEDLGVTIESSEPITVVALDAVPGSSDAAVVRPLTALGTHYVVAAWPVGARRVSSDAVIVAPFDGTTVTLRSGRNSSRNILLDHGQTWRLHSDTGDVTGTILLSNNPIAVFAGTASGTVPHDSAIAVVAASFMVDQLMPVSRWDTAAIVVPHPSPSLDWNNRYRVVAAFDSTVVRVNSLNRAWLDAGEYFELPINESKLISATAPIEVLQYEMSPHDTAHGDPFMMPVPPMAQYRSRYTIVVPSTGTLDEHYLLLTVPASQKRSLRLDGQRLPDTLFFVYNGPSAYSYGLQRVDTGVHTVTSASDTPFGLMVCGYGPNDSYGYMAQIDTLRLLERFDRRAPSFVGSSVSSCDQFVLTVRDTGAIISGFGPSAVDAVVDGGTLRQVRYSGDSTQLEVVVEVDDRAAGALVRITARDEVGNTLQFEEPLSIDRPELLGGVIETQVDVQPGTARCDSVTIANAGVVPLVIGLATFARNQRFSVPPTALPIVIPPGSIAAVPVCVDARGSTLSQLRDTLVLYDTCGTATRLAVRMELASLQGEDRCGTTVALDPTIGSGRPVLRVVPNPIAGDVLRLQVRGGSGPVELVNSEGRSVRSLSLEPSESLREVALRLDGLPSGSYWIRYDGATERVILVH